MLVKIVSQLPWVALENKASLWWSVWKLWHSNLLFQSIFLHTKVKFYIGGGEDNLKILHLLSCTVLMHRGNTFTSIIFSGSTLYSYATNIVEACCNDYTTIPRMTIARTQDGVLFSKLLQIRLVIFTLLQIESSTICSSKSSSSGNSSLVGIVDKASAIVLCLPSRYSMPST